MHVTIQSNCFAFVADAQGVTLRLGRREWFWSRDTGFTYEVLRRN